MSGVAASPTVLRLVNAEPVSVSPRGNIATSQDLKVRRANEESARLDALDARWVLAVRTTMALEGGRAAILRPADRRTLVALATSMGLRTFDAALVIAIAQDAARTGEALSGSPQERLSMVRPPGLGRGESMGPGMLLFLACGLGAVVFTLVKAWLIG